MLLGPIHGPAVFGSWSGSRYWGAIRVLSRAISAAYAAATGPTASDKAAAGVAGLSQLVADGARNDVVTTGTPATVVDVDGLVKPSAHNQLTYAADLSNSAWFAGSGATLGPVVAKPDGYTQGDARTVTFAATTGAVFRQLLSPLFVPAGTSARVVVFLRSSTTGGAANTRVTTNNTAAWNSGFSQKVALTPTWQKFVVDGVVSNGASAYLIFGPLDASGTVDTSCVGAVDIYCPTMGFAGMVPDVVPTFGARVFGVPVTYDRGQTENLFSGGTDTVSTAKTATVIVGGTYAVTHAGPGSVALSGAATGTVAAGSSLTVTASTTTLTATPTGTVGNLQCTVGSVRKPYLSNPTASAIYAAGTPVRQNLASGNTTQTITGLRQGCAYSILHQQGGTYTLSGAASGTTTAGVVTRFVASSSSLTLTASSAPTLLQIWEGTGGMAYVAGPLSEYAQAGIQALNAQTEQCLYSSDFTQASWTKSGISAALTIGMRGTANSASTLTATAANGTVTQTIALASAQLARGIGIARRTGSGTVSISYDGGATYTDITAQVTPNWSVIDLGTETRANPTIVIRLGTSGDAVDVDFVACRTGGAGIVMPMYTGGSAQTRNADQIVIPGAALGLASSVGTVMAAGRYLSPAAGVSDTLLGTNGGAIALDTAGGSAAANDGTNTATTTATVLANTTIRQATAFDAAGGMRTSANGGAVATASFDGTMGSELRIGYGSNVLVEAIFTRAAAAVNADLIAASAGAK